MLSETIVYQSKVGSLKISATESNITEITFLQNEADGKQGSCKLPVLKILRECTNEMDKYFAGDLATFTVPFLQVGTAFQRSVWQELIRIPFGKTISYLELSRKLGNVKAIRAAASANGKNSLAIIVPCHRVIGSDGTLVGYSGSVWRKKWLLDHEAKYAHGIQLLF